MRTFFKNNLLSIIFIFLVTCLIFFKILLKGLYPIPGDLLVSFYFPWYSGGWEGYNPWTTHKELLNADAIRQIYLWKEFAASEFKQLRFPLWNPYTFSGQPLLANFQSSVFYPLDVFYFLMDPKNAWILLIAAQPFLAGIFMFLAVRSFNLSRLSALFSAVAFMFSSYLVTWLENGNIAHGYIWFPVSIWSINLFFEAKKYRYLIFLTLFQALSILAGHPQTAIYLFITTFIYFVYKIFETKTSFKKLYLYIFSIVFSLTLTAAQLLPTIDFYKESPISNSFAKEVFERTILPYKNLLTFFASDFFGHPATNNFWSESYGDFTPYFGVVPLIFTIWAIIKLKSNRFIRFALVISLIFIISAVKSPITFLIRNLSIPLLDASTPSRFISISIFLFTILAGFGFDDFIKNFKNSKYLDKFLKFLMVVGIVYFLLWLFAILGSKFLDPKETWEINLAVTRRNLILPTIMFLSVVGLALGIRYFYHIRKFGLLFSAICLFGVTILGGLYYTNKFLPVSPKNFIFPQHPILVWLNNNSALNRFYGGGTAHVDYNFPTQYQIYGIEGYDSLRFNRYAQLLASTKSGEVPQFYLRSDGVVPNEENGYRKRIFQLLGVKYLLDKEDTPKTDSDWHYERFSGDKVIGIWQLGKFQIYERYHSLPRFFLTTKYYVAKSDQEIIQKIYDPEFNLERLILEQEPSINIEEVDSQFVRPKLLKYLPNEVIFETNSGYNSLLYLSDVYAKDWNVYIDGQKSQILRTHYALRSVAVPTGIHQVHFKYQPKSFTYGLIISSSSSLILLIFVLYLWQKKRL